MKGVRAGGCAAITGRVYTAVVGRKRCLQNLIERHYQRSRIITRRSPSLGTPRVLLMKYRMNIGSVYSRHQLEIPFPGTSMLLCSKEQSVLSTFHSLSEWGVRPEFACKFRTLCLRKRPPCLRF